jgi:hypothetical protein
MPFTIAYSRENEPGTVVSTFGFSGFDKKKKKRFQM